MGDSKERIDVLLVERGFFDTREKARKNIMAGLVFVNQVRIDKCGEKVSTQAELEVKGEAIPYVSRGGLKLEKAIREFGLALNGKTSMDIGASTGGFTDCMLQNGAAKVYAVDVGYGQFAWKLRTDERVVCMERTNIRYVTAEQLGELLQFASIDVSFISLRLVLPVVRNLLASDGEIIALIKPQFEAGKEKVGKKGVVRDVKVHQEVVENIVTFSQKCGFYISGLTYSPIKGPEGNLEYLIYLRKVNELDERDLKDTILEVVGRSHEELKDI